MSEPKVETETNKGTFYSVNLTDRRIVVIFGVIVAFFALVAFTVIMLLAANSGDKRDNGDFFSDSDSTYIEGDGVQAEEEFEDLSFHEELESDKLELAAASEEGKSEVVSLENRADNSSASDSEGQAAGEPESDEPLRSSEYKEQESTNSEGKVIIPVNNSTRNERKVEATPTIKKSAEKDSGEIKNTTKNTSGQTTTNTAKKEFEKRYVVQVGSYQSKDTASQIESFYKNGGYPTYVKSYSKDGKTYFRLRIGPFKEKERADKYLAALKASKYGGNSYITVGYF